jgi:hypothetical protein
MHDLLRFPELRPDIADMISRSRVRSCLVSLISSSVSSELLLEVNECSEMKDGMDRQLCSSFCATACSSCVWNNREATPTKQTQIKNRGENAPADGRQTHWQTHGRWPADFPAVVFVPPGWHCIWEKLRKQQKQCTSRRTISRAEGPFPPNPRTRKETLVVCNHIREF